MSFRNLILILSLATAAGACFAGSSSYSFEDGSASEGNFTGTAAAGQVTQAIGRVRLIETLNQGGDSLSSVSIALTGSRSGLSNFTLWTSSDGTFDGSDVQFGTIVSSDPGASIISFSTSYFLDTTVYLFLTADVASDAQGSIQAKVTSLQTSVILSNFAPPEPMSNDVVTIDSPIVNSDTRELIPFGLDKGAGSAVPVYGRRGYLYSMVTPFDETFKGGIRVAVGDVNGDQIADVITAAGPGGGPRIRIFDGMQLMDNNPVTLMDFFAFDPSFRGGIYVAAGDVNGDGKADIIVGADSPSATVKVFDAKDGSTMLNFFPYDSSFTGGVRVAAGDVNGDGRAEIITGAGPGGGPHVKVFDGSAATLSSFFAYDPAFRGGVFVAAGDVTGDGFADIVTGAGVGGAPEVKVFDGTGNFFTSFFAYSPRLKTGVKVGIADPFGDRTPRLTPPSLFEPLAPYVIMAAPGSKGKLPVKFFDAHKGGLDLMFGGASPLGSNFSKGLFLTP